MMSITAALSTKVMTRSTVVGVIRRPLLIRTYHVDSATTSHNNDTGAANQENYAIQFDKAHHQVAPLTNSTFYAPQGTSSTHQQQHQQVSTTTNTIFTPSVNAVFDD